MAFLQCSELVVETTSNSCCIAHFSYCALGCYFELAATATMGHILLLPCKALFILYRPFAQLEQHRLQLEVPSESSQTPHNGVHVRCTQLCHQLQASCACQALQAAPMYFNNLLVPLRSSWQYTVAAAAHDLLLCM